MSHELDGKYRVSSTTSYQGPIEKKSDGETEIINGQTHRIDDAGCTWTSTFEIISDTEVKMSSTADATNADVEFLLTAPDGTPTKGPVTYETILKLARKGERVQMSGQIEYGNDVVLLTMRSM